ncbi:MAG: MarR family winged helix-turn-helix transcriptional regulator [Massilia sp.]
MKPSARVQPGDPGITPLSEYLCFAVYSANLALGKAYKPILDELGLTYTQYIVVIALWEGGEQTVTALGEKLFLESNTLTPILKKLEAMGYVRRRRAESDERQVLLSLTEAGHRLRQSALGKNVIAHTRLTPEEMPRVREAIVKLRNNLIDSTAAARRTGKSG